MLTRSVTRSYGEISYFLDDDADDAQKGDGSKKAPEESKKREKRKAPVK